MASKKKKKTAKKTAKKANKKTAKKVTKKRTAKKTTKKKSTKKTGKKKTSKKTATKKKTAKKAAKKTAKKAAKKTTKTSRKKASSKKRATRAPSKKSAKKTTKKTAKKTAKKAAKKTPRKATMAATKNPGKRTGRQSVPPSAIPELHLNRTGETLPPAQAESNPQAAAESATTLVGSTLPDMTLENQDQEGVHLPTLAQTHRFVVLYFYPKDNTPGCTKEACDFRDNWTELQNQGVTVVGVSPDSAQSHQKFRENYSLNFDLLVDQDHRLAEALKSWQLKKFMGREFMGVVRTTFLIKDGKIVRAWQPVKVKDHISEVQEAIQAEAQA